MTTISPGVNALTHWYALIRDAHGARGGAPGRRTTVSRGRGRAGRQARGRGIAARGFRAQKRAASRRMRPILLFDDVIVYVVGLLIASIPFSGK